MKEDRSTTQARPPVSRREVVAALLALGATVLAGLYLELLGWRIIQPGVTLTEAWSGAFVRGGLRTAAGAAGVGVFALAPGLLVRRWRVWTRRHLLAVWGAGAGTFLLAMAALVLWAP